MITCEFLHLKSNNRTMIDSCIIFYWDLEDATVRKKSIHFHSLRDMNELNLATR